MSTSKDIKEPQGNNANRVLETGRSYEVMWPENNEYGNDAGRVSQCDIGFLTVETRVFQGMKFKGVHFSGRTAFNIHGKFFQALRFMPFTGNLIWNTYEIEGKELLSLINTMIESKEWHPTQGPTEQFEKFDRGERFLMADVEACF